MSGLFFKLIYRRGGMVVHLLLLKCSLPKHVIYSTLVSYDKNKFYYIGPSSAETAVVMRA